MYKASLRSEFFLKQSDEEGKTYLYLLLVAELGNAAELLSGLLITVSGNSYAASFRAARQERYWRARKAQR